MFTIIYKEEGLDSLQFVSFQLDVEALHHLKYLSMTTYCKSAIMFSGELEAEMDNGVISQYRKEGS